MSSESDKGPNLPRAPGAHDEIARAEAELRRELAELQRDPPPDVATVTELLDAVSEQPFSGVVVERLVSFLDADRPAAPAIVGLGLARRPRLVQSYFPRRVAVGLVAHASPPLVKLEQGQPSLLRMGCVPVDYQRTMRRWRTLRTVVGALQSTAAQSVLALSDVELSAVLRARVVTEDLAYNAELAPDLIAVFVEELIAAAMVELGMLDSFLDVTVAPIRPEGRKRLAEVVPETVDTALRSPPRPKFEPDKLLLLGPPGSTPRFFLERWIDEAFAHAAHGVRDYMHRLAA